ncbi:hypothetical protein [Streptomyces nodosus]|uniref:hypothetical protein n=1 Tax=Streptomyces nodosus TaxID=40318 RepID=UPI0037F3CC77
MSGTSGDGGVRWNDETQRWEAAGEAGAPISPPAPPPVPEYDPPEPVGESYDVNYAVTPPPSPTPRSRRTTALVAAATVAAVAGGIAGGVLGLQDHGGHSGAGSAGSGAASTVSASGTATSDSGLPTDTDTTGAWSTASPSPTDVPPGYVLHEDAAGFTIAVPKGWRRKEGTDGVFYNSPDGHSLVQIFAITEPDITPLEALTLTSRNLADSSKNYTELSLQDVPQDSGEPAAELVYAYDRPDGTRRQIVDHAFGTDTGEQYAVLVAGPEDDWPRQRQILEVALAHFSA